MASTKNRTYYKAVRRVVAGLNSGLSLKQLTSLIVRRTAEAMNGGASLALLDSTGTRLIHSSSSRLPQYYLRKGLLHVDKSISEVSTGQPLIIPDMASDNRIQYPEMAVRAGLFSMLGVPIMTDGSTMGSLRVYAREHTQFTQADVNFMSTMANLAAVGIRSGMVEQQGIDSPIGQGDLQMTPLQQVRSVSFVHPSEEEFARILDFYNIEWLYEPRSFPLEWGDGRETEMFAPDFYLPSFDLYVELTTLKQSLVTAKNRKLRRLRELYPNVAITLLYKKDIHRFLAKYGCGPLAQARGYGVGQTLFSSAEIQQRVSELAEQVSLDYADRRPVLVGILRGVFCFMADLVRQIVVPLEVEFMAISYYGYEDSSVRITKDLDVDIAGRHVLMVEDIVDTGMTLNYMLNYLRGKGPASLAVCALLDRRTRRLANVPLDYVGFEVADEFVVGYGLDSRGEYRNLPFIGTLASGEEKRSTRSIRRKKSVTGRDKKAPR